MSFTIDLLDGGRTGKTLWAHVVTVRPLGWRELGKSRMANSWRRLSADDEQLLAYACPDPFPVDVVEVRS